MIDPFKFDALINWLVAGALPKAEFTDTFGEIARRMIGAGLPVDTLETYMKNINPIVLGSLIFWTKAGGTKIIKFSHAQMLTEVYVASLQKNVSDSGRTARIRAGTGSPWETHPYIQPKLARGYTDYIMCPLFGKFIPNGAIAVGTKHAGGFTDADITAIRRLQAPLARVVEAEILHENTVTLLSTYVGRGAGEKVMDGRILRGYSENITAVVLFADLCNFTSLSNTLPPEQTIAALNTYFEALDSAIRTNGGETLKFIGDGLLAIFPTVDEFTAQTAAAMGAISALDDARASLAISNAQGPEIVFRAALHLGELNYGNIGSSTRLDFTAVGPAVNLTSRLLQASAELDAPTVCSDAFAPLARVRCTPAREFAFKGFDDGIMVHTVA